jgi:uncharacterized OB-fold protein
MADQWLQRCTSCGTAQYPPRELCAACLSDSLQWLDAATQTGVVLAITSLHHSHDPAFHTKLPLQVALVQLDAGATVVCFLTGGPTPGARVNITAQQDKTGRLTLSASS